LEQVPGPRSLSSERCWLGLLAGSQGVGQASDFEFADLGFDGSILVPPLLLTTSLGLKELTHILRVASEDYILVIPGRDAIIFARVDRELPTIH